MKEEAVLILVVGLLIALIIGICLYYRTKLAEEKRKQMLDPVSGLLTQEYLRTHVLRTMDDRNRLLYYVVYFHFSMNHIERLGGEEKARAFIQFTVALLRQQITEADTLLRAGYVDLIVVKQAETIQDIKQWTQTMIETIRTFSYAGGSLQARDAAAGIYVLASHEVTYSAIMYHARQCAYVACQQEIPYRICGSKHCLRCQEDRSLLYAFAHGLEKGEFKIYIQPFVQAQTAVMVGGEVLSRWFHPERGLGNSRYLRRLWHRFFFVSRFAGLSHGRP